MYMIYNHEILCHGANSPSKDQGLQRDTSRANWGAIVVFYILAYIF